MLAGVSGLVPLLLAVDGDSLVHRAHHAGALSEQRDDAGRPVWGLRGLVSYVASAAARLSPDAVVVGFDSRPNSVRKQLYPDYKAHRPDKHEDLAAQLGDAPGLLSAAGVTVVVRDGYEADDVLASAAELARRSGWRATLLTSDRDAFALLDETTSVLRLIDGGVDASPLMTPQRLAAVYGVAPAQYRDYAALRGDPSDNLPGVAGIGVKNAARLLAAFGSLDAAYAAIDAGCRGEVVEVIGDALTVELAGEEGRRVVERNRALMALHDDLRLSSLRAMRLPLDAERVTAALAARQIRLGPSLWALLGRPAPAWLGYGGYDRAPAYLPRVEEPVLFAPVARPSLPAPVIDPARPPTKITPRRRGLPTPVPDGQLALFDV